MFVFKINDKQTNNNWFYTKPTYGEWDYNCISISNVLFFVSATMNSVTHMFCLYILNKDIYSYLIWLFIDYKNGTIPLQNLKYQAQGSTK